MVDPLPHLGARDLGGRRVLHQVVERHAAGAAEPRLEVLHADADVVAEARVGALALVRPEHVVARDQRVVALHVDLVLARHLRVEDLARDRHEARVRDPGAVVAVVHLALLVGAHLRERSLVRRGVVLDRDLRRHPAHRVDVPAVAGLDEELDVGAEKRLVHRHLATIGEERGRLVRELLDVAEDVVPPAAVEAGRVLAELVEDLVHLERAGQGLDEFPVALMVPRGMPRRRLRVHEDVVPEARLRVRLHLRQVEVRAGAALEERLRVVEEVEAEVEERAGDGLPAERHVLLVEVPPARPHHQHRELVVQLVGLLRDRVGEGDRAAHRVLQVDLAADDVGPRGRASSLPGRP